MTNVVIIHSRTFSYISMSKERVLLTTFCDSRSGKLTEIKLDQICLFLRF